MIPRPFLPTWFLILYSLRPTFISAVDEILNVFENDGPICYDAFGHPKYCLSTLIMFDRVIADRGYGMNDLIEFVSPGSEPQHASQYPHEILTPEYYTFFLKGDPTDNHEVCVVTFGIDDVDPSHPNTVMLSHATMRAKAKEVIEACCYAKHMGMGGYNLVINAGHTIVDVSVFAAFSMDDRLLKARKMTMEYRPSPSNKEPSKDPPSGSGQSDASESKPSEGGEGESQPLGPDDKGKGIVSVYCNKSQQATTCKPGFACFTEALANQVVLWGLTREKVYDFIGMCATTVGSS